MLFRSEAESELLQELASAPQNTRAWTVLVAMLKATDRVDEARLAVKACPEDAITIE